MGPLYVVTERFGPERGAEWDRYIAWSGLSQLSEVVSLDCILCPFVADEVLAEDWPHIVNEDFMLSYFHDLDYLLRRVGDIHDKNLLCLFRDPEGPTSPPVTDREFVFEGYDLVDVSGGVSALTNCGGFAEAFAGAELSSHGLLPSLDRANEVRRTLRERYSGHGHEDCHVWAIHRFVSRRVRPGVEEGT
jgi:hypothetical protein